MTCYNSENYKPYYPPTRFKMVPVLFDKKVIDASMGTSAEGQPMAPRLGMYTNSLVVYEADDTAWIYDSMGNFTRIPDRGSDIDTYTKEEIEQLISSAISQEATVREGEDERIEGKVDSISDDLAEEIAIRQASDNTLSGEIDALAIESDTKYQRKLTAGNNITISGNTISATFEQSDWAENNASDPAYVKNRPMYEEDIDSTIERQTGQDAFNAGTNPVSGYVWYAQQVLDYPLHTILADFADGDDIYVEFAYSVNGVEKTGDARFTVTVDGNDVSLDSDMPVGNPWNGAYALEANPNTTFRWPVESSDDGATIFLTKITYTRVKKIDAKYIPVDSFYPVGSVYCSNSSTAPTFTGGTWSYIGSQTIGTTTVHYHERTA